MKYVGDAACASCHKDIAKSFHQHPMARSLVPIADAAPPEYDSHPNSFDGLGSHFEVRREGRRVWHRRTHLDSASQPIYEQETEVQFVIGSGTRGRSFLSDRDGYLFQSPISWYSHKQVWDLSPGAALMSSVGRHVDGACLFCHSNRAHFRPSSINHYDRPIFDGFGIGCERCHGPGELHVAARKSLAAADGPVDDTIVNPAHLPHALREAVCQQCHLQSEARVMRRGRALDEFRPGLPLEAFLSVIVPSGEEAGNRQAVNHVQQMYASRCFEKSTGDGKLGCISCHDPHRLPAAEERVAFFRQRCLNCHATHGCALGSDERMRQDNDCTACHMPRYRDTDVAHAAATDHRILRRPNKAVAPIPAPVRVGDLPVVRFPRQTSDAEDPEVQRDLGIGMVMLGSMGKIDLRLHSLQTVSLLETATRRDPTDTAAWVALAQALVAEDRRAAALTCYEKALANDPEREDALIGAGALCQMLKRPVAALDYWRRAVKANPWMPVYRANLVPLLIDAGRWDELRPHADAWLRLDPESTPARQLRITLLLSDGKKAEARAEFARLEALRPKNLEALRAWFAEQMHGGAD